MVSRGRRAADGGARIAWQRAGRALGTVALSALGACSLTSLDAYFQCPPSNPRCTQQSGADSGAGTGGTSAGSDSGGTAESGGSSGASAATGGSNTGGTGNDTSAAGEAGASGASPIPCTTSADCNGDTCSRGFCGPAFTLTYVDSPDKGTDEHSEKWIKFGVQINNRTGASVALQDLTIRYYFSYEGNYTCCMSQVLTTATPPSSVSQVDGSFGSTPDGWLYLEVGFESSAGKLSPESSSGMIQMGVHDSMFSDGAFDEFNDYSFNAPSHITMYRGGTLIWGVEPTVAP